MTGAEIGRSFPTGKGVYQIIWHSNVTGANLVKGRLVPDGSVERPR